jgi:hypothetical protein
MRAEKVKLILNRAARGIPGTGRRKQKPAPDPPRDTSVRVVRFDEFGKRIRTEVGNSALIP